ncbi:hypothetical protein VB735_15230 [Halotia wernerae UHCC 0503]|nr:hypothetical protein [Halotia wernerae UHCC 0503]
MTNSQDQSSRLDRIESILLQTVQAQQANTQAITQLGEKIDCLANRQDQFQTQFEQSIADLIQTIDYAVDRTEELVRRFLEQSGNGHSSDG